MQELGGFLFKQFSTAVTQTVKRGAQRPTPLLVPAGSAGIAATIAAPALHSMRAAPGCVLNDLDFMRGGEVLQELSVIGKLDCRIGLNAVQRIGQRHVAMLVVVAIGFAIGGYVHQLRPVAFVGKSALDPRRELLSAIQQLLKSHCLGNGTVIKKEVDSFSRRQLRQVGAGRINASAAYIFPAASANLAHTACLMRRQDRELDPL